MRVCSRACTKSHACTIIIHARRCAARLCARRISPQNLAARRGQHNVRFIFTFTSLAFCHSSCVYIYICIYIYIHGCCVSPFFFFFFPLSLFQFRFACKLPLLKPLLFLSLFLTHSLSMYKSLTCIT